MTNNRLAELRTWVEQKPFWDMMDWPESAVGSFLAEYHPDLLQAITASDDPLLPLARFFETSKLHMAWIVYYPFYDLWSKTDTSEILSHIADAENKVIVSTKILETLFGKELFKQLTNKP